MTQIIYFSKTSQRGPSSRYRIYQFLPLLESKGVYIKVNPLFDDFYFSIIEVRNLPLQFFLKTLYSLYRFSKRFFQLLKKVDSDVIVVEHQLFPYMPAFFEFFFIRRSKKRYLEFDDAVYLSFLHKKKFEKLLPFYTGIVAGNKILATFSLRKNKNVIVHPTLIDAEKTIPKSSYTIKGSVVIGWIGLAWNFKYIDMIHDALRVLSIRRNIVLKIISSRNLKLEGIRSEFLKWNVNTEWEHIKEFDIGIMPLEDNEWCRGKCGLKLLQYMFSAVPSVSSPIGVNSDIVDDGINGFLASGKEEWINKIDRLILSEELRRNMGVAAREKALKNFSLQQKSGDVVSFYKKILQSDVGDSAI